MTVRNLYVLNLKNKAMKNKIFSGKKIKEISISVGKFKKARKRKLRKNKIKVVECTNCAGAGHIGSFDDFQTSDKCDICNGKGIVKKATE